jgi:hypothetical protein
MKPRKSMAESVGWILVFAGFVFVGALWAITKYRTDVAAADIVALAAAVLGVTGTHLGHVAGHESAERQTRTELLAGGLERLAAMRDKGKLTESEFANFKKKLSE